MLVLFDPSTFRSLAVEWATARPNPTGNRSIDYVSLFVCLLRNIESTRKLVVCNAMKKIRENYLRLSRAQCCRFFIL